MRKPSEKKENTFRTINPENGLLCIKHLHLRRPTFGSCSSVQFLRNRYAWTLDFLRYAIFEHHVSHISSRNDIREFDIIKMVGDFDVGENVQKLCTLSELFWKNLSFLKTQFCTPRNQAALDQLSPVFALSFVSICALKLKGVICKSNDPGSSPAKIIALLYYQSQVNKGQISLKLYKVSCLSNWIQRCRGLN